MVTMAERQSTPLGDAIFLLRRRAGMSQKVLAQVSGIERSYISMLETGARRNASFDILSALASAVGVTTPELYKLAGLSWPELESSGAPVLSVDDAEKLPVLRRLAGFPRDQLVRLERVARILLLEGVAPDQDTEPETGQPDGDDVHPETGPEGPVGGQTAPDTGT